MLDIHNSTAAGKNCHFVEQPGSPNSNVQWLHDHFYTLSKTIAYPCTVVMLVGGTDTASTRIRGAQAVARQDLTPSHWSHAALVEYEGNALTVPIEISLAPPAGFGFPPPNNGIQTGDLTTYDSRQAWPNIALLLVPADPSEVRQKLTRLRSLRSTIDLVGITLQWLSYVWGVRQAHNPLNLEVGVPCAVMLEYAVGAVGFDLTPGLTSRSSCPEAIWQAARWWHEFHSEATQVGSLSRQPIKGVFSISHRLR